MDINDLLNAIMQIIFMITGLVSIKSLTEMITQLVGQGDALKDGADTGKEVKKLGAQATGVAVHGARIAGATAKSVAGVGKKVATSSGVTKLRHDAANVAAEAAGNAYAWGAKKILGEEGYKAHVDKRATRRANDAEYMRYIKNAQGYQLEADKSSSMKKSLEKKGDMVGASFAGLSAGINETLAEDEFAKANAMKSAKKVSVGARWKARVASGSEKLKALHFGAKLTKDDASEKYLGDSSVTTALGFKDGIGVRAMLKGDKQKDTVINQVLHGNLVRNSEGKLERENFNISNTVTNANKYIFNITGAKGNLKDFLDNADVLGAIEESQNAMGKTLQKVLSQTGVKSDSSKAKKRNRGSSQGYRKCC